MENLDITTIINRVRELSNSTPLVFKGHDGADTEFDASMIAATIVGGAMGCHCPMPTRPTPIPPSYFASTFGDEVQSVISKINEAVNIRTQVAYDAACAMWVERYNLVHKPCDVQTLLVRLSTTGRSLSTTNTFATLLLSSLNPEQMDSLEKIIRSVNLSCSAADVSTNPFEA